MSVHSSVIMWSSSRLNICIISLALLILSVPISAKMVHFLTKTSIPSVSSAVTTNIMYNNIVRWSNSCCCYCIVILWCHQIHTSIAGIFEMMSLRTILIDELLFTTVNAEPRKSFYHDGSLSAHDIS